MISSTIDWTARTSAATRIIRRHLPPTPLVPIVLDGFAAPAYLKLETLQPTGSFKVRGALAAVAASARDFRPVITASAGNHGLGIAYAATLIGADASIVVPANASPAKVQALGKYAVELRLIGDGYDEAEAAAVNVAEALGARFVSAYDDPDVIAGQSTIIAEVADEIPGPFQIVVPVGGGGLAAGTGLAAPERARVIGVEAAASRAVSEAMTTGRIVDVDIHQTLADGLAGNIAQGCITPSLLSENRVTTTAVAEDAIRAAVRHLALRHGVIAEGAASVGIAAAQAGLIQADLPAVFVITGRNITGEQLAQLVSP
ncbi:threonine dehydratase [Plantibacter flavus]|uniref:Threonine dehydratase n=1 Tax=Plantibacter flavus TaxID=150123 RepID=A0A3N2BXL3_9MICO|nr:pyridoxal-phosphate dependent enzyme [Plantibacter flavus]ROR80021.1 threonine dehydratase [Plantibacter flavus]SMG28616.1 threonine dehydratase [Plantibacter flavus]